MFVSLTSQNTFRRGVSAKNKFGILPSSQKVATKVQVCLGFSVNVDRFVYFSPQFLAFTVYLFLVLSVLTQ